MAPSLSQNQPTCTCPLPCVVILPRPPPTVSPFDQPPPGLEEGRWLALRKICLCLGGLKFNDLFSASARGAQVSYSGGGGVSSAGVEEERGGEDLVGTLQGCLVRSLACSSPAGQVGRGVRNLDYYYCRFLLSARRFFPRRESAEICRMSFFFFFFLVLAPCCARAVLSVRYNSSSRHRRIMLFSPESFLCFFPEMYQDMPVRGVDLATVCPRESTVNHRLRFRFRDRACSLRSTLPVMEMAPSPLGRPGKASVWSNSSPIYRTGRCVPMLFVPRLALEQTRTVAFHA